VRALLHERGVDPAQSLLLEFFPDDADLYWFLLVTQHGRAVVFEYDCLSRSSGEGTFVRWEDMTSARESPHAGLVEAGLFRLEEERGRIL
jgi:hypothetical protein